MTRITGTLINAEGLVNGRLFAKPSRQYLGAPSRGFSFKIVDGIVDISLPPNPPGTCWLVGWRDKFQGDAVEYSERWIVPWAEEVDIDEIRHQATPARSRSERTENLDKTLLKVEAQKAKEETARVENENAKLLQRLTAAESRAASAMGKIASLDAEVRGLQRKAANTTPQVEEKIVERRVVAEDARQILSNARREVILLQEENQKLKEQAEAGVSASTHLANLQAEVDRLRIEKQHLLARIEELKQPQRSASSLRRELIANLDRLIDG